MEKQVLIVSVILVLLTSALIGVQAVRAQNASNEQFSVSISPSGAFSALAVYFVATVSGRRLLIAFNGTVTIP